MNNDMNNMSITKNISPLRYPGGKTRACKLLYTIINNNFDMANYTAVFSPFFGGGSFEFYLQNKFDPDRHIVPELKDKYYRYFEGALDDIFLIDGLQDILQQNSSIKKRS